MKLKVAWTKLGLIAIILFNHASFGMTITEYSHAIEELQAKLLEIHQQFYGQSNNIAILELLLTHLFKINYRDLSTYSQSEKKNAIYKAFTNLGIRNSTELEEWSFTNFVLHSTLAENLLNSIKVSWNKQADNTVATELLLNRLFKMDYQELINTDIDRKKLDTQMLFNQLGKLIKNPFDVPIDYVGDYIPSHFTAERPGVGSLVSAENAALDSMIADKDHFKDLILVSGQRQEGDTCGSHAIINAWAIEQLLKEKKEITAVNIFEITAPYFGSLSYEYTKTNEDYPINEFIEDNEICNQQIPKLIEDKFEQTNFKKRVMFVGYHSLEGIESGVNITGLADSPNWFLHSGSIAEIASQIKVLLTLKPHVQHFVYNSGGHWVLASVVQQPGQDAVIYFIDSMGNKAIDEDDPIMSRFVLSLYENFVKR